MRRALPVRLLVLAWLAPVLTLLVWSVSGVWRYPNLLPRQLTGRGWRVLLSPGSDVLTGLITSLTVAVTVSALAVAVGLPAGRALGLYDFRGKRLVRFLLLAPALVPGMAVLLGTQVVFLRYGLADTLAGVVLVQLVPTVPYASTLLAGAFENYDVRYEQQARVLGASPLWAIVSVTLPALRPALIVTGYLAFLISWSEYVLTLLIGGGQVKTLPLLLFAYAQGSDVTLAAAVGLLLITPPLLLLVLLRRYLSAEQGQLIGLGRL